MTDYHSLCTAFDPETESLCGQLADSYIIHMPSPAVPIPMVSAICLYHKAQLEALGKGIIKMQDRTYEEALAIAEQQQNERDQT